MTILDIVFAVVLVSFFITSYLRGAIKEIFTLAGVLGGFFVAHWYNAFLAGKMLPILPHQGAAELLAYVLCIVAGYFLGMILGAIADMVGGTSNSELIRIMGGLIGLLKGWTILLGVFWVVSKHMPSFMPEMGDSIIGRLLGGSMKALIQKGLL